MLTQDQKSKLEPLTRHEKYGKLLSESIKNWEITSPKKRVFGITQDGKIWKLSPQSNNCCCLIGAALLNNNAEINSYSRSTADNYQISFDEVEDLVAGFDRTIHHASDSKAYEFGNSVSEIVFEY